MNSHTLLCNLTENLLHIVFALRRWNAHKIGVLEIFEDARTKIRFEYLYISSSLIGFESRGSLSVSKRSNKSSSCQFNWKYCQLTEELSKSNYSTVSCEHFFAKSFNNINGATVIFSPHWTTVNHHPLSDYSRPVRWRRQRVEIHLNYCILSTWTAGGRCRGWLSASKITFLEHWTCDGWEFMMCFSVCARCCCSAVCVVGDLSRGSRILILYVTGSWADIWNVDDKWHESCV